MGKRKSPPITPIEQRLMAKVRKEDNGCWHWLGANGRNGHGNIHYNGTKPVHRVAYEIFKGPIPDGLHIDHLCRNRWCVNPDHLEAVTPVENVMRGEAPSAQNARKTHCAKGHEYSPENTIRIKNGWRRCRQCVAAYKHAAVVRKAGGIERPQHGSESCCPRGHEYTEANTWRDRYGKRYCRACHRMHERNRRIEARREQVAFVEGMRDAGHAPYEAHELLSA